MIRQNTWISLYNLIFAEPLHRSHREGQMLHSTSSSFPPPVTTCFLPQHFHPPHSPAASSVPGPMAPSVTAQVLCEQRPWGPPCHRAAAFSLSTDFHRFPSHFHCQPEARLHNFPGPFCEPPASCFLLPASCVGNPGDWRARLSTNASELGCTGSRAVYLLGPAHSSLRRNAAPPTQRRKWSLECVSKIQLTMLLN